ncbi:MAG: glycosyltransferase [Candidatus Gastranaerophilales bacterium]|nr:glycosyltransferase [Candidatus Gastranaerophilales bacterium]
MPKVSVVVPIYNVEKYLRQCLDSILNQTLKDIEIICINDGSKDSCPQILKEYSLKDGRIKVINKENTGYGNSMNIGFQEAIGEYIGIVESDDFVKSTMFEELYNLAKNNDADVVKSDFYYYSTANNQARHAGKILKSKANKLITIKKFPKLLKIQPSIWTCLYKNDFIRQNKIKFLETPGASFQDTSFCFKTLSLAQRIILTNKAYLYYRQDNSGSSVHQKDKVFLICKEYDEITDFLDKNPEVKKYANTQKLIKQYSAYIWNLKRISEEHRDSFIDVFSDTFKKYYENNELNASFYRKYSKKEVKMLINNKKQFRALIDKKAIQGKNKNKRRKMFSIRINSSRISIVIFGKQILEIG